MITKETFISLIEYIQAQCAEDARMSHHINELVRDNIANVYSTPLISHVVQALEAEMCDEFDTVSWWLWDAPAAGTNKDSAYIELKTKSKFYLNDAADLYDYLKMEYTASKAQASR